MVHRPSNADADRITELEGEVRRLQNTVEVLTVLNDISLAAGKGMSVDETLSIIVEKCRRALGAEQGSLLIASADDARGLKTLVRQDDQSPLRPVYHVGASITGYVLHKSRPLLIHDLSADHRFEPTAEELASIRSVLCVPVFSRGELVGAMMMINKEGGGSFTENDHRLPTVVAGLAGELLQNRQLHDEALRRQEELTISRVTMEKQREIHEAKSRFFSSISHDVRTPLTLMLAPLEELAQGVASPEDLQRCRIVRQNALRLLRMINQLLDFSRVEAGAAVLHVYPGDLARCLRTSVEAFDPLARQKGIRLEHQLPEAVRAVVAPEQREKIFFNLLSNAIKFTPHGGAVFVSMTVQESQDDESFPRQVEVVIRDTGAGIPENDLGRVFDRFYQGERISGNVAGGSGIGLTLVKEFVEQHRGTVNVTSEEGKGSSFVVTLPLQTDHVTGSPPSDGLANPVAADADLNAELASLEADLGSGVHSCSARADGDPLQIGYPLVLIVEDDVQMRTHIRNILDASYRVFEAPDGRHGFELACEMLPDLIISDVLMPGMSGQQLCRALKDDQRTSHIPVILLTARADLEYRLAGLDCGADDYLTKPFVPGEVKIRAANLIDQRRRLRERFSGKVIFEPGTLEIPSRDEAFLVRVHEVIQNNLGDDGFTVDDLARGVSLSYSQLHRKLQSLTGQPPTHYIRGIRLRRGLEMLKKNAGTVSEIAFSVGFSSPAYFTRCFHAIFGVPPSEVAGK